MMKTIAAIAMLVALTMAAASRTEAGAVTIKGSNTFGEDLGPTLITGFSQKHPGITVELESAGSGSGINSLLEGTCDIASSSRVLNEDEIRMAKSRGVRVESHVVGYYGIAVVAAESQKVASLTDKQVQKIFTGEIRNWKDVGGVDAAINLYIPKSDSGTYLGFQELAMNRLPYASSGTQKDSYHEIAAAVEADPNGIGYVSLTVMRDSGLRGIMINGISPTPIAVVEGLYPYARMVRLMTVKGHTSTDARAFVRYVQSKEGQNIVDENGFVPRMRARMTIGSMTH